MRKLKYLLTFSLIACSSHGMADEASVRKILLSRVPEMGIDSVHRTPFFDLYEVRADGVIFYTDEAVTYLFVGNVLDGRNQENLTAERSSRINAIPFDQLPLGSAVTMVKGKGTRKLAYFADPLCSYCRRLDAEMAQLDDVTIYIFPYPILSQDSVVLSRAVLCSANPAKAWADMMTKSIRPRGLVNCKAPQLERIVAFGAERKINITPTLVLEDDRRIEAAMTTALLDRMLTDAQNKRAEAKEPPKQ